MSSEITIRPATINDIDFIITCIIEAERAGTKVSSYEKIFSLSENELRKILRSILLEEICGCELCCTNFFLAFDGIIPVAGIGAWLEGKGTQGSNTIRVSLFSYFLDSNKWKTAQKNLKIISQHEILRSPNSMQLESACVSPEFRGKGLIQKIFTFTISEFLKKYSSLKLVQIFTLEGNMPMAKSLMRMNWKQTKKVLFQNENVLQLLPGTGKILWELDLTDPKIIAEYLL
jgi:hypothetical protein